MHRECTDIDRTMNAFLSTAGGAFSTIFSGVSAILHPLTSSSGSTRVDGFAEDRRAMAGDLRKVGGDMRAAIQRLEKSSEFQET